MGPFFWRSSKQRFPISFPFIYCLFIPYSFPIHFLFISYSLLISFPIYSLLIHFLFTSYSFVFSFDLRNFPKFPKTKIFFLPISYLTIHFKPQINSENGYPKKWLIKGSKPIHLNSFHFYFFSKTVINKGVVNKVLYSKIGKGKEVNGRKRQEKKGKEQTYTRLYKPNTKQFFGIMYYPNLLGWVTNHFPNYIKNTSPKFLKLWTKDSKTQVSTKIKNKK